LIVDHPSSWKELLERRHLEYEDEGALAVYNGLPTGLSELVDGAPAGRVEGERCVLDVAALRMRPEDRHWYGGFVPCAK
jgi:hypothetical protein